MYSILATGVESVVEVAVDRSDFIVFVFVFLVVAMVIFAVLYKIRLEHKQIMAAIDKGMPLSDLKPAKSDLKPVKQKGPAWIRNLTAGIALLIIAIGFAYMAWQNQYDTGAVLAGFIFCGLGVCFLVRGLLLRKVNG